MDVEHAVQFPAEQIGALAGQAALNWHDAVSIGPTSTLPPPSTTTPQPRTALSPPLRNLPQARRQVLLHLVVSITCPVCHSSIPVPTRAAAQCRVRSPAA